jgi:hypothetical protein
VNSSAYPGFGSGGGGVAATPTTTAEWKVFFEKLIKLGKKASKKSGLRMLGMGAANAKSCVREHFNLRHIGNHWRAVRSVGLYVARQSNIPRSGHKSVDQV